MERVPIIVPIIVLCLLAGCGGGEAVEVELIPLPRELAVDGGAMALRSDARIVAGGDAAAVGELLAGSLRPATGFALPVAGAGAAPGDIELVLDSDLGDLGDEGYQLVVGDRVTIRAPQPAGLFYGAQTLRQLLPPEIESATEVDRSWKIPRVTVRDWPRFGWRGVMVDVARHFFTADEVMRVVDLAAYHKLNVLHLHLTDDQGWRIQIDSWPRLTTVGGATEVGGGDGGYYSKADYAAIVAYAAARFVTVVPEIDMPGHCNAALAAYGELSESGEPADPYTGTDVGFSSLWIGGPVTLEFADDVLGEVAAMTPGPYLHIGGDEAMATDAADYERFIGNLQEIVDSHGKQLIGWEEIARGQIAPPVLAQHWLRQRDARAAANKGAKIIASPATNAYLDIKYDSATELGQNYVGFTDVDKAYDWDPVIDELTEDQIAGIEAPLWTETVATWDQLVFMVFPRLPGHAEIGWSAADGRSWADYELRLAHHGRRLDAMGLGFYRSPVVDWLD